MSIGNSYNKYALVTGGSSGMGLEYVRNLARRGYNVIIVALFQNETDAVRDELSSVFPNLDFLSIGMDLTSADAPSDLYGRIKELRPDAEVEVLVNNAGILNAIHFRNMSQEAVSRSVMLHCHTIAMLCSLFIEPMLERKRGYILNISSLGAWFPFPFLTTYASTKAFVRTFTRALRTECKGSGVNVCTVYFGAVDTPLFNLSPSKRKLARRLGVMITPEKAAGKALKMMFKGRSGYMPGFVNKIAYIAAPLLRPAIVAPIDRWVTRRWNYK